MPLRPRFVLFALAALIGASAMLPESADARSSRRRNYADEMRRERIQEEREERYREERREREDRYYEEREEREERYYDHRERMADKYIAHRDRVYGTTPKVVNGKYAEAAGAPCLYGDNNKVLHRPKGSICIGDEAPSEAGAAAQAKPAAAAAQQAPAKASSKGRCIYGKSGKVLWAEPGADC